MDKVLVITGASRGIGAATARLAGAAGYSVCVNYRQNERAAEQVVRDIEAAGARAIAVAADVSMESDVVRLFETADRTLGRLSGLVNNAGILETQMRVDSMNAARLHRVLATNVVGAFMCAREAVRRLWQLAQTTSHFAYSRRTRRRDRQCFFWRSPPWLTRRVCRLCGVKGGR